MEKWKKIKNNLFNFTLFFSFFIFFYFFIIYFYLFLLKNINFYINMSETQYNILALFKKFFNIKFL